MTTPVENISSDDLVIYILLLSFGTAILDILDCCHLLDPSIKHVTC
jgi:hypothetical protein